MTGPDGTRSDGIPGGESRLLTAVRGVLDHALVAHDGDPAARAAVAAQRARLGGPLRVALTGTVKAGKSTLLNALVGERVAPTGVGECTRLVTHYSDAPSPRIAVDYRGAAPGGPRELPVRLHDGALAIDLDGVDTGRVAALHVGWPSAHLRAVTLVDTPGVDSARGDAEGRARALLAGAGGDPADQPTDADRADTTGLGAAAGGADVVVHLVRHLAEPDVAFLEAFGDAAAAGVGPAGTVVVLSRADEVGGGRADAVLAARQVARRYRADPAMAPWCTAVTTVAGLLAETARTLRAHEFAALRALAALPREALDEALVSADRFVGAPPLDHAGPGGAADRLAGAPGVPDPAGRLALLDRFGLVGVRLAVTLLRRGVDDSAALSAELTRRSGLDELRELVDLRFRDRADVFQARAALRTVEALIAAGRARGDDRLGPLAARVERLRAGAHELVELDRLAVLRTRPATVPGAGTDEIERLLGGRGAAPARRLGLDPAADAEAGAAEVRAAALSALVRWRGLAEDPRADRAGADLARTVVRSVEGTLAVAAAPRPRPARTG